MIDLPPPQFDTYHGGLVVIERPAPVVRQICMAAGVRDSRVLGCSVMGFLACLIVVPKVDRYTTQEQHDRVLRHELGHCAGWRHA